MQIVYKTVAYTLNVEAAIKSGAAKIVGRPIYWTDIKNGDIIRHIGKSPAKNNAHLVLDSSNKCSYQCLNLCSDQLHYFNDPYETDFTFQRLNCKTGVWEDEVADDV